MSEVRTIASRYRQQQKIETTTAMHQLAAVDPDETVLKILADPFRSIEDTATRLAQAETYLRSQNDRRSVFLTVYTTMTSNVQAGIQSGYFKDPDWVREYVVTFAEYYRRAVIAFERRDFSVVPRPWQIAFLASTQGKTLVAQDALLGINAHINYDLTYTLSELTIDSDRDNKREDHDRINEILQRLIDVVQDALVAVYAAVGVSELDALLGSVDEQLAVFGFKQSRLFAWRNAVLLTDIPLTLVQRYVDWRTRTVSTGAAYVLYSPRMTASTRQQLQNIEAQSEPLNTFHTELTYWVPDDETKPR